MKNLTPMLVALVAAATLTLSGCDGGSSFTAPLTPPGTQDPGTQDPGTQDPGTQDPGTPDNPVPLGDTDGDGVVDTLDAFPLDPVAAVDSDGDGFPDAWNVNAPVDLIADSALTLDAFKDCRFAAVATAFDSTKPARFHPSTCTASQLATCVLVASDDNDDDDGD
jgi:hypothetical protein